jgi:integrase/recombinase XerD
MDKIRLHQFAEKLELLGYSKRVIADYPASVELFFRYLEEYENIHSIVDVKAEHISAYHAHLQYSRIKDSYLSAQTVRARLMTVKTFFRIMSEENLLAGDPSREISLPKQHRSLPRHVPGEKEMMQLLDSIEPYCPITIRDRAMLELLYATGIRSEEARDARVSEFDQDEKILLVRGKGSKDRIVPVGEWVLPFLREYLHKGRPRLENRREPSELLFLSKNGRKITRANMVDLIRKYAQRAGLTNRITPHCFRHACATHLLRAGADIRYVQELLGHADLSSTQIYTRIDITFLKQAHGRFHPRERNNR